MGFPLKLNLPHSFQKSSLKFGNVIYELAAGMICTETPSNATPINASSHFDKTYKSEKSMKINFFSITS
jgi:hypothetical protein